MPSSLLLQAPVSVEPAANLTDITATRVGNASIVVCYRIGGNGSITTGLCRHGQVSSSGITFGNAMALPDSTDYSRYSNACVHASSNFCFCCLILIRRSSRASLTGLCLHSGALRCCKRTSLIPVDSCEAKHPAYTNMTPCDCDCVCVMSTEAWSRHCSASSIAWLLSSPPALHHLQAKCLSLASRQSRLPLHRCPPVCVRVWC
jgi:hypothetical protein